MFQPHSIVHSGRWFLLMCHTGADYRKVPLAILLNPLRYSVTFRPGTPRQRTLNRNGRLNIAWANYRWHLRHPGTDA